MKRFLWWLPPLMVAGLGWLLIPSSSGHAQTARSAAPAPTPNPTASTGPGARYYAEYCSACHGAGAQGTSRAPSLQGVGMAEVDFQLTTGRMPRRDDSERLPPYTAILPGPVIRALDQYVTAIAAHGGPGIPAVDPSAGDVAHGGELFRENCAACHSELGQGGELVDRSIPSITEATPTQAAEAIRAGAVQMPKFGTAAVSRSGLNDIVAYMQYLKHPADKGGDPLSHLGPVSEGMIAWFIGMVVLLGFIRWIGQRG